MRALPRGLYALSLTGPAYADFRIVEVTGPRLGSATRTISTMPVTDEPQHQAWSQRLRLLGECLREMTATTSNPRKTSLLDQSAWKLSETNVRPPSSVGRLLGKRREQSLPEIDKAVFEFVLRMGAARLPQFLAACDLLAAECHRVTQESARRRQVLFSILREAAAIQPPYLPQFSPFCPPSAAEWRLNPSFGDAAVKIFLDHHLPDAVSRDWASGWKDNYTFEKMCLHLIGVELAPFNKRYQPASAEPPDVVAQLREMLPAMSTHSSNGPVTRITHLATSYTVVADDAEAPRALASWIEACRQLTRLTTDAEAIWQCVNSSLEQWAKASSGQPENVRRLLEILPAFGPEIVSIGWMRGSGPGAAFHALAGYGALSAEDVATLIDFDLLKPAHKHFRGKAAQLSALLSVLPSNRDHWRDLKPTVRTRWLYLFFKFEDGAAAHRLSEWLIHLRRDRGFTFHDIGDFIGRVRNFVLRKAAARQARETFLACHLPILDRILDEVEITLRELPETGFGKWRSHAEVWDRTAGAFEILFQWKSAGYGDSEKMLEELFAWCRRDTRKAMVEKRENAPDHFWDVSNNEAVVVRLAAGSTRYLLRLLERYTISWNYPDDPFDGWCFLDCYPAVQQYFQRRCQQPKLLYGTMLVLRRIALAVRLQRRAALGEGLDRWVAASTEIDPAARIRAFREIAGYKKPLPAVVERLRARETGLRKEVETLSAMLREGRLTPSAAVRLAKVERWLQDPERLARWIDKDIARAVEKMLLVTQFNALSAISREAVRTHWKEVIDPKADGRGPDWDNALHFYYSADENKELLREMLRHSSGNNAEWRRTYPPNAKFAVDLRTHGFDIERWLEPLAMTREVRGSAWKLYLEPNPLRVLQMGNLFSTCLSLDDFNAFSAIANAADINKQVLYVEDAEGTVIGRKLIGLTADGRIFGFKSYGASCLDNAEHPERPQVWIKVMLDLACLQIAQRLGGQFDQSPDSIAAADQLKLSADWYNDGPEGFDWWIENRELSAAILQNEKAPVADAVIAYIQQNGLKLDEANSHAMASLRAMLWLEEDAARVIETVGRDAIPPKCARYLRCQSKSAAVREMLG